MFKQQLCLIVVILLVDSSFGCSNLNLAKCKTDTVKDNAPDATPTVSATAEDDCTKYANAQLFGYCLRRTYTDTNGKTLNYAAGCSNDINYCAKWNSDANCPPSTTCCKQCNTDDCNSQDFL